MRISLAGNRRLPRRNERGLTLLELLVTLGILALLAGLTVPALGHWLEDWKLQGTAERIAQTVQEAHTRALFEQRYYVIELLPPTHRLRVLAAESGLLYEYDLPTGVEWGEQPNAFSSPLVRWVFPPSGNVEKKVLWLRNQRGAQQQVEASFREGGLQVRTTPDGGETHGIE